jgi:hypothetical protein
MARRFEPTAPVVQQAMLVSETKEAHVQRRRVATLAVVALLVGCGDQGPLAPYTWQGVGQTASRTYVVELVYTMYGANILGSYYLDGKTSPTGKAEGHADGDVIVLNLSQTTTCKFSFVGTINDTRLTGTFIPDPCPGALAGTWDLLRRN